MAHKIALFFLFFAAFSLSGIADERFPDSDIQWILDQYHVSPSKSLIPDEGFAGWTRHYGEAIPAVFKWTNQRGKFVLNQSEKTADLPGGDLVTAKQYTNFILDFVWIASKGCNSGIKYRLKDFGKEGAKVNYSEDFGWLGCEFQILDTFHDCEDGGRDATASLYTVFAPDKTRKLNPFGEINTGRIVVLDTHIEHWLNGKKVLDFQVGSESWKNAIATSKFSREDAKAEGFGENPSGLIMLQDHGNTITYEKVIIREIGDSRSKSRGR